MTDHLTAKLRRRTSAAAVAAIGSVPSTPPSCSEPEKIAFNIPQACAATGLGKTSIYEAIKSGKLKSIRVCGRRLVLKDDLQACLNSGRDAA